MQLCGFTDNEPPTIVLTMWMLPPGKTRSSRFTLPGSPGRFGISTIRPALLNTPLATTTLLMTVRVPETPEVTMVPLNASLPLVAAASGAGAAAETASAVPATHTRPEPA